MSEKLSPLSNDLIEKMEKVGEKIKENKINLSQTAKTVIEKRYLIKDKNGKPTETAENMFWRVAVNIASADLIYEPFIDITEKAKKFYSLMSNFEFLPNSPTLMNAGRDLQQLSACFVLPVGDSMESIFDTVKNTALIHKTGGGTGFSFSNLRPKNDRVATTGGVASGPLSFMRVFNSATDVIKQGGVRRGANMAILNVDHPDILEFITAKKDTNELTNFNLSVGVNEDFMERVMNDQEYNLINPNNKEVVSTLRAREVFDLIVEMAWQNGEPGIVFIDRLNKGNPTPHIGSIESTNPCGEQPLLPYEACNLGSINLSKMIKEENGKTFIDYDKLEKTVRTAVSFLDNVIDVNRYPLKQIDEMVKGNRKIGLGVMGFADMLTTLDITYNSNAALKIAEDIMNFIQEAAYKESTEIAKKRGAFPNYEGSVWEKKDMRLRNATVTTIAPTGTLSILSNCSSGIEPIFGICFVRQILGGERFIEVNPVFEKMAKENSFYTPELMEEIAEKGTLKHIKGIPAEVRKLFVTSYDVAPIWHIKMQAAFQKYTDNAVSKTVNFPENATREDIKEVYYLAYQEGCKGVTVYRNSSRSEQVISVGNGQTPSAKTKPSSMPPPRTIEEEDDAAFFSFDHLQTHRNLISPRSRPEVTFGITEKIPICKGNLYITINYDEYGICEVLLQNKDFMGHFCNYNLEMLGKFISLAISSGIQIKHILEQLKGKKCANCINNAETSVLSCSDGISKVLERAWMKIPHFMFLSRQKSGMDTGTLEETVKQLSKNSHRMGKDTTIIENNSAGLHPADEENLCPECQGQIEYVEGCMVCRSCGYSKCG